MPEPSLSDTFRAHERHLFGLLYRLTGSAADAEDLVQETFARALARPPADTTLPWRPWLVKVAVNLGRDHLRARRRRPYDGPWLPEAIETAPTDPDERADTRYGRLESVTLAFLVALESLSPPQRAVLLLRDVFDYSVRETAAALDLTETNVKVTHHRARAKMAAYDARRRRPDAALAAETRRALEAFLGAILRQDAAEAEKLLAADARAISDGGGEFAAARRPVFGRERVARLYLRLAAARPGAGRFAIRTINGLPTLWAEMPILHPHDAPRFALQVVTGADGAIETVFSVLATPKVRALVTSAP